MIHTKAWNPARLAAARRDARLSQEALADRMTGILGREAQPVRARNIVRWESPRGASGAHAPHSDFIPALAEATGKDADFFFQDAAVSDDEEEEEEDPSMREAFHLFVDLMARLNPNKQQVAP